MSRPDARRSPWVIEDAQGSLPWYAVRTASSAQRGRGRWAGNSRGDDARSLGASQRESTYSRLTRAASRPDAAARSLCTPASKTSDETRGDGARIVATRADGRPLVHQRRSTLGAIAAPTQSDGRRELLLRRLLRLPNTGDGANGRPRLPSAAGYAAWRQPRPSLQLVPRRQAACSAAVPAAALPRRFCSHPRPRLPCVSHPGSGRRAFERPSRASCTRFDATSQAFKA